MTRIDTTARYQDGELEKIIGRSSLPKDFEIDTKILKSDLKARRHRNGPSTNSLKVILNLSQVNTIYYRAPDFIIPIAVQARALNDQYKESRFKPSTFHGQYHLLCRSHEENLIPLLRRHNIHYAGYSPYPPDDSQAGRRVSLQTPFTAWYGCDSMHEAVDELNVILERSAADLEELSLVWLVYHCKLEEGDVVILGTGSKLSHFDGSLDKVSRGPLGEDVTAELGRLWESVRADGMAIKDTNNQVVVDDRSRPSAYCRLKDPEDQRLDFLTPLSFTSGLVLTRFSDEFAKLGNPRVVDMSIMH